MNNESWLDRLQMLSIRFAHLGLCSDIGSLSVIEAWSLYRFLSRLADEYSI
jgi:hypothetical protein